MFYISCYNVGLAEKERKTVGTCVRLMSYLIECNRLKSKETAFGTSWIIRCTESDRNGILSFEEECTFSQAVQRCQNRGEREGQRERNKFAPQLPFPLSFSLPISVKKSFKPSNTLIKQARPWPKLGILSQNIYSYINDDINSFPEKVLISVLSRW